MNEGGGGWAEKGGEEGVGGEMLEQQRFLLNVKEINLRSLITSGLGLS